MDGPTVKDVVTVSTATATPTDTLTEEDHPVRELPFQVEISDAPDGYRPDRSSTGRKRIPSPYEAVLPGLKNKGWKNQPHEGKVVPCAYAGDGTPKFNTLASSPKNEDGTPSEIIPSVRDSNARYILRELQKAVKFLNLPEWKGGSNLNLGLDVNVTGTDVQFNIRDKQKRRTESAPGGGDVTDGEIDLDGDFEDEDSDADNGDE